MKRDVTGDAVDALSATILANFPDGTNISVSMYPSSPIADTMPYNIVPGTQPTKTVTVGTYFAESDCDPTTHQASVPIPSAPSIEGWYDAGGALPTDTSFGDGHMLIAVRNETTGGIDTLWELYKAHTADLGANWLCEGLARFNIATGAPRLEELSSVDAAGLSILSCLIRYDEVASGVVPHALRASFPASGPFTWPARHGVSATSAMIPFGGRIRLTAAWYAGNAGNYTGQARALVDAMRLHGVINCDGSGLGWSPQLCFHADDRWDWTALPDTGSLHNINAIPMTAFEVIKITPGITFTGPASGAVGVPQTFTIAKSPVFDSNYNYNGYLFADGSNTGWSTGAIALNDGSPSGTATFTPPAPGAYSLTVVPSSYMVKPPAIAFTTPGSGDVLCNVIAAVADVAGGVSWLVAGPPTPTAGPNPFSLPGTGALPPNPYTLPGGIPTPPLPPAVFYTTITIYRSAPGAEQRGDPLLDTGAVIYDGPASVYPDRLPRYSESHLRPEGAQQWHYITPTDPGATTGDVVHWTDRVFSVLARSADHSGGLGREWWTGCVEVS